MPQVTNASDIAQAELGLMMEPQRGRINDAEKSFALLSASRLTDQRIQTTDLYLSEMLFVDDVYWYRVLYDYHKL